MTARRTRDPILRDFLRAAAIAFALRTDTFAAQAHEKPEATPSGGAQARAAGQTTAHRMEPIAGRITALELEMDA